MTFRRADSLAIELAVIWWRCASAATWFGAASLLVACGSGDTPGEADGSIRGELQLFRVDYLDGHSERELYLSPAGRASASIHLQFASDPQLQPWTKLKVWGTETADGLKVDRYQEDSTASDEVRVTSEPLTQVTKKTRSVGFVLMDVGNGVNLSAADATTAIFGTRTPTQAGLNQFYVENSYGGFGFSGDILGPKTVTNLGTCQQSAINAIEGAWPDVFGKDYDHWMQYIGSDYMSCGWGGIGGEGTAARPAYGSWYNASTSCTVLNQEVGHNLGLMHSNSITCNGAPFADDPLTCQGAEYGNRHTVMGSGCGHLGAYEKWYEGFFGGCNAVRANASGTYTVLPTETPCDGVQALQIPMPKTRPFHNTQGTADVVNLSKYYLELRTKTSIDGKETAPSVLVTVGGEIPASNKTSQFTWVLDMDPTTKNTAEGLTAGKSFSDPGGGVSFTVQSVDATHATVNVTLATSSGPATCIDGSTFVSPGPSSCGTTGGGGAAGAGGASIGGAGGALGMGGASGAAGNGGSGGIGSSGASGAGGAGGASGAAGSAGAVIAGSGGTAGFAAATGGGAGKGGSSGSGAAGAAGSTNSAAGTPAAGGSNGSSGCSCRTAPANPSRSWLAGAALLVLGFAFRRRRQNARLARGRWLALGVSIAAGISGCSSKSDDHEASNATTGDASADSGNCASRAEPVSAGLLRVSAGGYVFELDALAPAVPVQSAGPPGNDWTVMVTGPEGAPVVDGALLVTSYMPDHAHSGPPAVGIARGDGGYDIAPLILPMPALYQITLTLTLESGAKESVVVPLCMSAS